jgi:hypothetical protein
MKGDQFFWVAPKSSAADSESFEPASVDFKDGEPDQIWFTGNDFPFDAKDCVIAERITRKAGES